MSNKNEEKLKLLRLVSGATVLAMAKYDNKNGKSGRMVSIPMEVMPTRGTQPGEIRINLMEFVLGAVTDEPMFMAEEHIICAAVPNEDMAKLYEQTVNPSAIELPPEAESLILPPSAV